jgi:hypothetical protein
LGELSEAVKDNVQTSMTVEEARTLLATLQNGEQQFDSVGLSPPLVEPAHPDYAEIRALLQMVRSALSAGTALDLPTEPTEPITESTTD